MFIIVVNVHVKTEHIDDFIEASVKNAQGTHKEAGAVRFDVLHGSEDPSRFVLYEVYENEAAFAAHQQTEHYSQWRESVADWMAEPRTKTVCTEVFPTERDKW
jgi:(4S)-4-hydroxy-5-phosphonooxypentane-2,3-dione isomerase